VLFVAGAEFNKAIVITRHLNSKVDHLISIPKINPKTMDFLQQDKNLKNVTFEFF
jgi:hypothetical protein